MTPAESAIDALDAAASDPTLSRRTRSEWSKLAGVARQIAGQPPNRGRPATVDREKIRRLLRQCQSREAVAGAVGCSVATVAIVAREMAADGHTLSQPRKRGHLAESEKRKTVLELLETYTESEVARILRCSPSTIAKIRETRPNP